MPTVRDQTQNLAGGEVMWEVVGIVAACVVILLMLQLLDVAEKLKVNFLGRKPSQDIEQRADHIVGDLCGLEVGLDGCLVGFHSDGFFDDIDNGGDGPNMEDVVYLVTYMFSYGPVPECIEHCDIDGSGEDPNIADLVYLVNYMFNGGPAPAECNP